eukprot:8039281-Alexandrium_andersonii.AAC.1
MSTTGAPLCKGRPRRAGAGECGERQASKRNAIVGPGLWRTHSAEPGGRTRPRVEGETPTTAPAGPCLLYTSPSPRD